MMDIPFLMEYVDDLPTKDKKLAQADAFIEMAAATYMASDLSKDAFMDNCRLAWEMIDRDLTRVVDECSSVN